MAEYQSGNLFIRDMESMTARHEAGWKMSGHAHNFDHNTLIAQGRYRCRSWGVLVNGFGDARLNEDGTPMLHLISDVERGAGSVLFIDRNMHHDFECVEGPGLILCLYSHRDPQTGDVVQEYNGWTRAYV